MRAFPGFQGFEFKKDGDSYVVTSSWATIPEWEAWSLSDECRRSHLPLGIWQLVPQKGEVRFFWGGSGCADKERLSRRRGQRPADEETSRLLRKLQTNDRLTAPPNARASPRTLCSSRITTSPSTPSTPDEHNPCPSLARRSLTPRGLTDSCAAGRPPPPSKARRACFSYIPLILYIRPCTCRM
jgi:hypothetical protein